MEAVVNTAWVHLICVLCVVQTQSKIDTNEGLVSELESKVEFLRQSNVALESRNMLLVGLDRFPHQSIHHRLQRSMRWMSESADFGKG